MEISSLYDATKGVKEEVHVHNCTASHWSVLFTLMSYMTSVY